MAEMVKTLCQMCSRLCGMNVYLQKGRVIKTEGMPEHPCSKGGLCAKGLASVQYEHSPQRLLHPLKRIGERGEGKWQQITWEEALDITARKLKETRDKYGAPSIFFYRGQGAGWGSPWVHQRRFMNALGSPNYGAHSQLCYIPRQMAWTYTVGRVMVPDFENAKLMILWGYNPFYSAVANLGRRVVDARKRGAKMIVIDPRFTGPAAKADIYVQPRPGTDGALALAMLNVVIEKGLYDRDFVAKWTHGFDQLAEMVKEWTPEKASEITWVPAGLIREIAELYGSTRPATIEAGNGVDQVSNSVQTARAITCLIAISGNLDRPGGNVLPPASTIADMTLKNLLPQDVKSIDKHPLYSRIWHIASPDLTDSILTGEPYPIRAMLVQAGDPALTLSESERVRKALRKLDFLAVHDLFMTSTAELADIVFPAASFLEEDSLSTYSFGLTPATNTRLFGLRRKVLDPPGECHSDLQFIFQLARKMGLGDYFPWETAADAIEEEIRPTGRTMKDLMAHPEGILQVIPPQDLYEKFEKEGFATGTKKVELYSPLFEEYGYDPLPRYVEPAETPFSQPDLAKEYPLIGSAAIKPGIFTHTQFRNLPWLKDILPEPWVEMHPRMAESLGIKDGEDVYVESPRGKIKVKAMLTEGVHPRAVFLPHGWGEPYAHGAVDNMITPDAPNCPVSSSNSNRAFLCRVTRVAGTVMKRETASVAATGATDKGKGAW